MVKTHNATGRSRYDTRHVRLDVWLYKSAAWRFLKPQARAVYIELVALHNGYNNGEIALSVRNAACRCNIAKGTAGRALQELQDKGFIVNVTPGWFSRKVRHASEYRLTALEFRGEAATKDFMLWRPENLEHGPKSGTKGTNSGTATALAANAS